MSDLLTQLGNEKFEAFVSKGIHALLFPVTREGVDTTRNLLYGYPVGGFNTSGDTVDQEEFQDQIRGGMNKTFLPGLIDPGDITFNTYFTPDKGKPEIPGVVDSMVMTPQFILILARKKGAGLEGFLSAGVNYASGNDLKGDYGKTIGSSLKFKITGEVKSGYAAVGPVSMELYRGTGD